MITINTLTEIISKQRANVLSTSEGIIREELSTITLNPGFATIISGIRRCGKSTLLRQLIGSDNNFNYLNFEDVRLFSFELDDFTKLDSIISADSDSVYYFDEIQNIAGWERFVRTLLNSGKKVVITGSNASMLSKDLGTKLTGRHLQTQLHSLLIKADY
jgi:predicted AAA+ superfamily ATPase